MRLPKTIKVYGDTSYRGDCRSENAEQKDCFGRLKERYPELYKIAIHPKNEGKRDGKQSSFDKVTGALNTGASDIIIPTGFVCELKRRDHTKCCLTKPQIEYLESAQDDGAFACIALTADDFEDALKDWLESRERLNKP